jgi:hypothetical protein
VAVNCANCYQLDSGPLINPSNWSFRKSGRDLDEDRENGRGIGDVREEKKSQIQTIQQG